MTTSEPRFVIAISQTLGPVLNDLGHLYVKLHNKLELMLGPDTECIAPVLLMENPVFSGKCRARNLEKSGFESRSLRTRVHSELTLRD